MKFKFKIQGYQTEAVDNTTAVFTGQPNRDSSKYRRDLGKRDSCIIRFDGDDDGYRNADVELSSKQLLENLHSVQASAGVPRRYCSFSNKTANGTHIHRSQECCRGTSPSCQEKGSFVISRKNVNFASSIKVLLSNKA